MNKKIIISLIIICLAGVILGLIWLDSQQEKINPLCADFELIEGEVSCQEAIDLSLTEYPGEVNYINKDKISMLVTEPPELEFISKNVWLIGIHLKSPIISPFLSSPEGEIVLPGEKKYEIEVAVDRYEKNILIARPK